MGQDGDRELPDAVLFACNMNAVRSPMAEAIMRQLFYKRVYVDSVGVRSNEIDPFVVAVMEEIGIDMSNHHAKTFGELEDTLYDLIITLTPEAHNNALEMTRTMAVEVEYWPTQDPTIVTGSRAQRLEAYRAVRDALVERIRQRFGQAPKQKP